MASTTRPRYCRLALYYRERVNEPQRRGTISQRTTAALAAKKAQGAQPGTPANLTPAATQKGWDRSQAQAHNERAAAHILLLREKGLNYSRIVQRLNALRFQKYTTDANGGWQKYYRAPYQDCKQCPRKPICVPKSQCRHIIRTAYDPAYKRAWTRQQSKLGERMKRLCQSTVEPVFGSLIHHYGLRRISMRGKAGAHKAMLLAAIAFNLKKLLNYRSDQHLSLAVALAIPPPPPAHPLPFSAPSKRMQPEGETGEDKGKLLREVLQQPRPFS